MIVGIERKRKRTRKKKKKILKYIDSIIKTIVFYLYFLHLKMDKNIFNIYIFKGKLNIV